MMSRYLGILFIIALLIYNVKSHSRKQSSNNGCIGTCPSRDPMDTSIYLPNTDCSKFCQCSNGVAIVMNCPKGLEFNPKLNVCDWPYSAGCSGNGNPPTSPPKTTNSPSHTTDNPITPTNKPVDPPSNNGCIGTCPSRDLMDTSIYLPNTNCSKFCQCSNGVAIVMNCSKGLEFNPILNVCDWPYRAGCSGNGNPPTSPPKTTNSPPHTTDNPITPTNKPVDPPSNNGCIGTCPSRDPMDTSIYLPNTDCSKFCQCSNGVAIVMNCPKGLEFNPKLNVCDWPYSAGCSGNGNPPTSPPKTTNSPPHTTDNPITPTNKPVDPPSNNGCIGTCPSRDPMDTSIYLPNTNCSKFCQCSNGVAIVMNCSKGLEFNSKLNVCDWPYRAGCSGNGNPPTSPPKTTNSPPHTTDNPITPTDKPVDPPSNNGCIGTCPSRDPMDTSIYLPNTDCSKFCQCSNGVAIVMNCPKGLEFNPKLNVCDWPYSAGCSGNGNPPTSPPKTTNSPPHTTDNPITPTNKPVDPPSNNGCIGTCPSRDPMDTSIYLPNTDCSKFCQCSNGVAIVMNCPKGLEFNPKLNVCDWPYSAGCSGNGNPPTSPPKTTNSPPHTTDNPITPTNKPVDPPSNNGCIGTCPSRDPMDTSIYLPNTNCSKFCQCSNGVAIVMNCSKGLEFNPILNVCDWPYRAGCSGNGNPPTSPPKTTNSPPHTTDNPITPTNKPVDPPSNNGCIGTCPSRDPMDTSIYLPNTNCSKFCQCSNGVAIVMNCSKGLEFNPILNVCDWPYRAGCSGNGNPPTSPPKTTNSPPHTTDNPITSTNKPVDPPSNNGCIGTCPSRDPMDTSIYLPNTNCSKFCQCSNGVAIVMNCSKGLEFNPKLNVCDWPYRAGCSGNGNPPTSPPKTTNSPPHTTDNPITPTNKPVDPPSNNGCIGTCPSRDPMDTSIYLPNTDCSKFCQCSNGVAIVMNCPKGLEFNPKLNVCDWPYSAGCSGNGNPPTSPPKTTNSPPHTTDNPITPTNKPVDLPSNNGCIGTCPSRDPMDTSIYLPNTNCSKFCQCSNGVAIVMNCSKGLEFNPILNVCDWPYRAGCSGNGNPPTSPPKTTNSPPHTTDNPITSTNKPVDPPSNNGCIGTCPSRDPMDTSIYLPNTNCSKFCQCSNGVAIVMNCSKGLEFNSKLNVCDWPYRAGCSGNGNPPTSPPKTTNSPSHTTDNPITSTNKPVDPPSNNGCIGTCPSRDPMDTSIYLPNTDCSKFCQCSNGVAIVMNCSKGLEFNPKLNVCDWPYRAGCSGNGNPPTSPPKTTNSPSHTTDNPITSTNKPVDPPSNNGCIGTCPSRDPMDTSIYLPNTDCSKFCQCSNGVAKVMNCSKGLEFNPKLNVCDWPHKAGCVSLCPALKQDSTYGIWSPIGCSTGPSKTGTSCYFTCNKGYQLVGSRVTTCGDSGWNGIIPYCQSINEIGDDIINRLNKTISNKPYTLIFLMDESGSVHLSEFELQKLFVESLVAAFPLSAQLSAGVITFASDAYEDISPNTDDTCTFIQNIKNIKYTSGGTHIAKALEVAYKSIKDVDYLNRPALIFLLTDGVSFSDPTPEAVKIKNNGDIIWTMGIGGYHKGQLENIASSDLDGNPLFFGITDFKAFGELSKYLQKKYMNKNNLNC